MRSWSPTGPKRRTLKFLLYIYTQEDENLNTHQLGDHPEEVISSPPSSTSMCSISSLRKPLQFAWTIARYDYETKRILNLAIPFTCSAIVETTSDLVILAIFSQYLGTDSAIAYAMVDIIVGIGSEFMCVFVV